MAWLCLNFDDDSDYDYVEYTGPLETSNNGGVAQLVERLPCKQEVEGSIPFTSTDV